MLSLKKLHFIVLFCTCLSVSGQNDLNYFKGNLDSALLCAEEQNKDIFLITKSLSCHVYKKFISRVTASEESVRFLNGKFIIYEYDLDKASKLEKKRMKQYYHSWRGFPQLYIMDKNEKIITEIIYPLNVEQERHLAYWKNYKQLEDTWKRVKQKKQKGITSYTDLVEYLDYRQIKYSSLDLIQMNNVLKQYFKGLNFSQLVEERHWELMQKYISIHSNPEVFDRVAQNRTRYFELYDNTEVSKYLLHNYQININWRKPGKVEKLAQKYPYNTVPEALKAIELYDVKQTVQDFYSNE
jgi:hypothetical protein